MSDLAAVIIIEVVLVFLIVLTNKKLLLPIIFVWIPLQNFVLPYLYTTYGMNKDIILGLIYFKEIAVTVLFVYLFLTTRETKISKAYKVAIISLITIGIYSVFTILYKGFDAEIAKNIRLLITPFELFITGYLISFEAKDIKKNINLIIIMAVIASLFGIYEVFFLKDDFWVNHANIAKYNVEVKGDSALAVYMERGISGTTAGRAFLPRRLSSTYGDPLSFGIANSFITLFLFIIFLQNPKKNKLILIIIFAAVFLTLSRSSWVLILIALLVVMMLQKQRTAFLVPVCIALVPLLLLSGVHEFIADTVTLKIDSAHQTGVAEFFTKIMWMPRFFLGEGIGAFYGSENGYSFIISQIGYPGIILFLMFVINVFKDLKLNINSFEDKEMASVALALCGIMVGTIVINLFSHYPFAFNAYFNIWITAGMLLGLKPSYGGIYRKIYS
ncbi:MAG: O-antigen ligase family protein [Deltaproteobacteria bacterium]